MVLAVCFDLYETLVTEFDANWRARTPVAERLGVSPAAFEAVWQVRRPARMTSGLDYREVLREVCRVAGRPIDDALVEALHAERLRLKASPFAQIDADVTRLLDHLRRRGVKLGLVSNCAVEEVAAWQGCALAPYFDAVVFSYQCGRTKPDPRVYALACARLAVRPEHARFVGDGGGDELAGAAAAGLRPHWATWFLDRWPPERRHEPGRRRSAAYPRLRTPADLLAVIDAEGSAGGTVSRSLRPAAG